MQSSPQCMSSLGQDNDKHARPGLGRMHSNSCVKLLFRESCSKLQPTVPTQTVHPATAHVLQTNPELSTQGMQIQIVHAATRILQTNP